ncbi:hypothetical protein ATCC90586_010961 [Pythium insidiosum]|nr:hypothetical protein ATCC90586_010961 [Pythium insidiosum]
MKWNVPLTEIALETRYKDVEIKNAFAKKNLNGSKINAIWQKALNILNERALLEDAFEGMEERVITLPQYKNKLKAVAKLYREKRKKMLQQTGNLAADDESDEHPEVPDDFYVSTVGEKSYIREKYVTTLGSDLAPLWPLICECLGRIGCTGEAIVETVAQPRTATPVTSEDDEVGSSASQEEDDRVRKARAKAKSLAKAKRKSTEPPRGVDVVSTALKGGFEMIEKVFSTKPDESNQKLVDAVQTLSASLVRTQEEHRAFAAQSQHANNLLAESVRNLQRTSENLQRSSEQTAEIMTRLLAKLD